MALQTKFRRSPEKAIASYSYFDIAEGSDLIEFLPFLTTSDGSNLSGAMTINTSVYGASSGAANLTATNKDFDVVFNLPKIIEGNAFCITPIRIQGTGNGKVYATIKHVDLNGVETTIGAQATSESVIGGGGGVSADKKVITKFTIARKKFKKGEKLRLNLSGASSGSVEKADIGLSPVNTQLSTVFATNGSRSSLFIPFRNEI